MEVKMINTKVIHRLMLNHVLHYHFSEKQLPRFIFNFLRYFFRACMASALCSRSYKIYAKNGENSCLNLTFSTIPTCKALIGDLQITVQSRKYLSKISENLIFSANLKFYSALFCL